MSCAASYPGRILMTADSVGGVWTYAMELAGVLASKGIEVSLATMGAPLTDEQREQVRILANVELFESSYKLEWMSDPWDELAEASAWLIDLEQRLRPDLVHLNSYVHGALPWKAPVLVVGHSCVLSWWNAVRREAAPPEWDPYREAVAAGLRGADLVVAPSKTMLEMLHHHYGPFHCSRVVLNGRALPGRTPTPKEPFLMAAGRFWDAAKNLAVLEHVAPSLPWTTYVAGESGSNQTTRPGENLVKLGRLSPNELERWLARASIYAFPALYEPFGLSVLEAALAGCALVVGDIPSLRELWTDAAIFVSPESHQAVREGLMALIRDPVRLRKMAALAQQAATAYHPEAMARSYLRAYQRCRVLRRSRPHLPASSSKQKRRYHACAVGSSRRRAAAISCL